MDIENMTIRELREVARIAAGLLQPAATAALVPVSDPYSQWIGKPVFIRSVTHHYVGILRSVHSTELVLEDASWIANDGRFADALKTGIYDEVEPYPDGLVILGRGAILDACLSASHPRAVQ